MEKQPHWIELEIAALHRSKKVNFFSKLFSKESPMYVLVLVNKNERNKAIEMLIGEPEAQAIAIKIEGLKPSRPLIQDLFKITIELLNSKLKYVVINKLDNELFYTSMCFSGTAGAIDSRPSDSIAIALRFNCPIYIHKEIFDKLAIDA